MNLMKSSNMQNVIKFPQKCRFEKLAEFVSFLFNREKNDDLLPDQFACLLALLYYDITLVNKGIIQMPKFKQKLFKKKIKILLELLEEN